MTDHVYPKRSGSEADEDSSRLIPAGFWMRCLAFCIDIALIGAICAAIGHLFDDFFISIGPKARIVGAALFLGYTSVMNSKIYDGQSFGKRLCRLRIVNIHGKTISLRTSAIRQTILGIPIFLNDLPIGGHATDFPLRIAYGLANIGIGGAIAYLAVFNTQARRSLHDLVSGSYVVHARSTGNGYTLWNLWIVHIAAVSACAAIAIALPIASTAKSVEMNARYGSEAAVYDWLIQRGDTLIADANFRTTYSKTEENIIKINYFQIIAYSPKKLDSISDYSSSIIKDLIGSEIKIPKSDYLLVTTGYGFDFGIYKYWNRRTAVRTLEMWKTKLELDQPKAGFVDDRASL